jgi:hypothetical protein
MERFLRFVRRNTNRRIIDMTDKKQDKCPRCDGMGELRDYRDGYGNPISKCPNCQGTGKKPASKEPEWATTKDIIDDALSKEPPCTKTNCGAPSRGDCGKHFCKDYTPAPKEPMTDKKQDKCPRCDGDGWIEPDEATCPDCRGSGKKPVPKEPMTDKKQDKCQRCDGKGWIYSDGGNFTLPCSDCQGTGKKPAPKEPDKMTDERKTKPECPRCKKERAQGTLGINYLCEACRIVFFQKRNDLLKDEIDALTNRIKELEDENENNLAALRRPCVPGCAVVANLDAVHKNDLMNIDALTQKVAELEGCLSGNPHLTATKEEREHWRHCAILYSNKLEQKVKDLEAEIKKKDEELMVRDKALELMAGHTIKVDWYLKQAKKLLIKKDASKKPDDKCSKCANNGIECLTCWAIIGEDADDNFKPKRKGIGKK